MAITATISQEEMLGVLLAYSSSWQTILGVSSADEALQKIRAYQADDAGDNAVSYPRVVIEESECERMNKATRTLAGRGALLMAFELQAPDDQALTVDDQRRWIVGAIKGVMLDMQTTSSSRSTPTGYSVSHFQLKTIAFEVEPFLVPESEREPQTTDDATPARALWMCQLRVEY
jgi:hypothetical protein